MRAFLKLNYFNSMYQHYLKIVLVIGVFLMFFGVNLSLGWLLGNLFFFLNLCLKNEYFDFILTMKKFSKLLFVGYYLVSLFLLVGSFGLGFLIPNIISPYSAFVGVLGFKFYLFATQFLGGETIES